MSLPQPVPPVLLRIHEVEALTSLKRTSLYRRIRAGTFPEPIELSANRSAWHASEVHAWIASRPRARPAKSAAFRALARSAEIDERRSGRDGVD